MDLDPAVIIPALLFTVVAIYFASSYLKKTEKPAEKKKPKVGYGDEIPPSRALGVVQHYEPKVEKPPVIEHKEVIPEVAVAPVVEEIGVVEEQPAQEPEIVPVVKETEVKHEPEPEPEVVAEPVVEAAPEPVVEAAPEPVVEAEPEPVVEAEPEPVVEAEPEPEPVPAPVEEPLPELISGLDDAPASEEVVLEPSPELEAFEHNELAAAEDQVKFTPGKKQSKFETLMTKEEMEEEQRIELTADFTSL